MIFLEFHKELVDREIHSLITKEKNIGGHEFYYFSKNNPKICVDVGTETNTSILYFTWFLNDKPFNNFNDFFSELIEDVKINDTQKLLFLYNLDFFNKLNWI